MGKLDHHHHHVPQRGGGEGEHGHSGSYIHTLLVEQNEHNTHEQPSKDRGGDGVMGVQNLSILGGDGSGGETTDTAHQQHLYLYHHQQQQQQQRQQRKHQQQHPPPKVKQVRRRLHISRPYQERLLDMAEARREIVTALKFHRAAMKQAADSHDHMQQQQQQQQHQQQHDEDHRHHYQSPPLLIQSQSTPLDHQQEHEKIDPCSGFKSLLHPSSSSPMHYLSHFRNTAVDFSGYWAAAAAPSFPFLEEDHQDQHHQIPACCFAYADSPSFSSPSSFSSQGINLQALPDQTLGLNLNFQDFNADFVSSSSWYNSSTDHSSSASSPHATTRENNNGRKAAVAGMSSYGGDSNTVSRTKEGGLHAAMDVEEMAEIRSMGEQHQMEWDDALNLATSAWWFKFLDSSNNGMVVQSGDDDDDEEEEDKGGSAEVYYRNYSQESSMEVEVDSDFPPG